MEEADPRLSVKITKRVRRFSNVLLGSKNN